MPESDITTGEYYKEIITIDAICSNGILMSVFKPRLYESCTPVH